MNKKLNLLDATLLVAGSMIGSGIFIVSSDIARTVGSPGWLLASWAIAGIITILGALSYGELAAMFPQAGGTYVYLREAYNSMTGFLFGWTLFMVVQCGTIAAVAVAFAKYTGVLMPVFSEKNILLQFGSFTISAAQLLGIACIAFLTFINARGIQYGKAVLRLFTGTKLISLLGLVLLGIFVFGNKEIWELNLAHFWDAANYWIDDNGNVASSPLNTGYAIALALGVSLVGSLFSCDAWNNVTFISGEIENPKRNLPLSLLAGTVIVIGLYLLANVAYLFLLPFYGDPNAADVAGRGIQFATNDRVATAAASMMFGEPATVIMAALIMISTFGCNNGIVLASARLYQAMAKDGLFFQKMKDNNSFGVPGFALWVQFAWASILCLSGKYGDLLDYIMFAVMAFYILTIAGIFILRKKRPDAERPYKAFGYPFLPLLYILLAAAFCVNILYMKPMNALPGFIIVLIGVPVYYFWNSKRVAN